MAKGYDQHKNRMEAISSLGKDLTRRSGSRCELCSASGVPLKAFEVPPEPAEPELNSCVFICENCTEQIENPKKFDQNHWRGLNSVMWSEITAVQVMTVRLLQKIAQDESWAGELLEELYLDPEIEEWVNKASL
ncbi:MAG: phnA protein [bacterium]|nr:phnA protein [bacterium]